MLKWNAPAQAAVNTKRIIKPQLLLSDELIRQRQERREPLQQQIKYPSY